MTVWGLVRNALGCAGSDRGRRGEVRGGEALEMLQAVMRVPRPEQWIAWSGAD
jgi:Flp pilus assembly CpaF family ATPase